MDKRILVPIDASDIGRRGSKVAMTAWSTTLRSVVAVLLSALAIAPDAHAESRGELLYTTHCITCHTSAMHWRDKKAATDWTSLKSQVRRWQGAADLGWSESDIQDVSRYLNESFYRYAQTSDRLTLMAPSTRDDGAGLFDASLRAAGASSPRPLIPLLVHQNP